MRALLIDAWARAYGGLVGREELATMAREALSDAALAATFAAPESRHLVAERAGALVGVLSARRRDAALHVARLYVRHDVQGQGVGSALLARLRADAPQTALRLHVEASNAPAQAFYAAMGFREAGRARETVAGVTFDVLVLALDAGAPMARPSNATRTGAM